MTLYPLLKPDCEHFSVVVKEVDRLDKALQSLLPHLSRSRLQSLIKQGCVYLDGTVVDNPSGKTKIGQTYILLIPPMEEAIPQPEAMALDVVYEDADLLVINKPAGLVVHPGAGNTKGTLVNALLAHCGESLSGIGGVKRPGIVHRIDKETSGLLLVAKNDFTHQGLSAQFSAHTIMRCYHAIVWGVPKAQKASIDKPIGRDTGNRQLMSTRSRQAKRAVTHYEVLTPLDPPVAALIACRLETGRTHQIRVHMAHMGHPLVGDPTYGIKNPPRHGVVDDLATLSFYGKRQALHAKEIGFLHPRTQKTLHFDSAYPNDFQSMLSFFVEKTNLSLPDVSLLQRKETFCKTP